MIALALMEFEPINLPLRMLSTEALRGYRVYRNPAEFVTVEASMAAEAIEKSGVANPFKVVRAELEVKDVLPPELLKSIDKQPSQGAEGAAVAAKVAAKVENPAGKA